MKDLSSEYALDQERGNGRQLYSRIKLVKARLHKDIHDFMRHWKWGYGRYLYSCIKQWKICPPKHE